MGAFLINAVLRIKLDAPAKEYVKIIGNGAKYKRGSVSFRARGKELEIKVAAKDAVAVLSSLNSAIKQLRVVGGVNALFIPKYK